MRRSSWLSCAKAVMRSRGSPCSPRGGTRPLPAPAPTALGAGDVRHAALWPRPHSPTSPDRQLCCAFGSSQRGGGQRGGAMTHGCRDRNAPPAQPIGAEIPRHKDLQQQGSLRRCSSGPKQGSLCVCVCWVGGWGGHRLLGVDGHVEGAEQVGGRVLFVIGPRRRWLRPGAVCSRPPFSAVPTSPISQLYSTRLVCPYTLM